ncbi:hypothetical protein FOA52_010909 [Chlamydomonas sp. UWO 241]|nr:hypothetical protein FOA52_010909 [Chlamydomonas sp. UWO 241]
MAGLHRIKQSASCGQPVPSPLSPHVPRVHAAVAWPARRRQLLLSIGLGIAAAPLLPSEGALAQGPKASATLVPLKQPLYSGEQTELTFLLTAADGHPVQWGELESYSLFGVKPHRLHIKIYDDDLEGIEVGHVHPEEFGDPTRGQAQGRYTVKYTFPGPSTYNVTAQFAPTEAVGRLGGVLPAVVLGQFPVVVEP